MRLELLRTVAALVAAGCISAFAQVAPKDDGVDRAPDEWLLASRGQPWWYQTKASPSAAALRTRSPSSAEQAIVDRARTLLDSRPARVIALLDGDSVVYAGYKAPANADSILFGFSMGKTVTSVAVGQAVCAGKLKMDTAAGDLVPELKGKALGRAKVRDLLMMSSSAAEPHADSTIWTAEQFRRWGRGELTILESVTEDRVAQAARGVFSEHKPGDLFSYKSTDAMVLGLMVSRATGMPYSQWVQATILDPMGAARTGLIVQDKAGDGATDAGIRLRLEDWIRFAQWVKRSAKTKDCLGEYLRAAMATQRKNTGTRGRDFGGYGYLTWTEPSVHTETAWAFGHGGQLIGWEKHGDRIVIVFSSADSWKADVFTLVRDWTSTR